MMAAPASVNATTRNDLLDAVRLIGVANGYIQVEGVPICPLPAGADQQAKVLPDLAAALYSRWYARWWPPSGVAPSGAEDPGIVPRVRAAHAASARFDTDWVVHSVDRRGYIAVTRDAEELYLQPGDYVNLTRLAVPVQAGDTVAVTKRRDSHAPQEGWWYTWGSVAPPPSPPMLRVYWNCGSGPVAEVVGAITAVLEDRELPYMLKCPSEAALFGRCDAVVLYVSADVWNSAREGLRAAHQRVLKSLCEDVPRLAMRLGRGVAIAEDPADGRSFGESRSRAVADGVIHVLLAGAVDTEDVLETMAARLIAHDICPARPYLRPGSAPEAVNAW